MTTSGEIPTGPRFIDCVSDNNGEDGFHDETGHGVFVRSRASGNGGVGFYSADVTAQIRAATSDALRTLPAADVQALIDLVHSDAPADPPAVEQRLVRFPALHKVFVDQLLGARSATIAGWLAFLATELPRHL